MKIYGDVGSGNCLKVKYTADRLGLPYAWVPVDIMKGETRTPEFLQHFPLGRIPAVEFDDGRRLAESNAIIRYLAHGSPLLPEDPFAQAKVDEWLFWEQYSHEPYIATTRYHIVYLKRSLDQREAWRVERGEAALNLMDRELSSRSWLAGETMTVADIALRPRGWRTRAGSICRPGPTCAPGSLAARMSWTWNRRGDDYGKLAYGLRIVS